MKLILHIGTEKTGTTTIQHFLNQNREAFDNNGFHVLKCAGMINMRAITAYCMNMERIDDFFMDHGLVTQKSREFFNEEFKVKFEKELGSLRSEIHTTIISSEQFHSRLQGREELLRLKELLDPYFSEICILCYLREQSSLAESAYSSNLRAGSTQSLSALFDDCNPDNAYYNFLVFLDLWSEVFEKESLNLRIFDRNCFVNGDLIQDFLAFVDEKLLIKHFEMMGDKNVSISNMGKIIARSFNLVSPKYDMKGQVNNENRQIIQQVFDVYNGKGNTLSKEQYDQIYQLFSPSNTELGKRYFGKSKNPFSYKPPQDNSMILKDEDSDVLADMIRSINHCSYFSVREAAYLRDAAVLLEDKDMKLSLRLMEMAHKLEPKSATFREKLEHYKRKLRWW